MKNVVVGMFMAGALLLSASGPTLAAGKLGGAGGMDVTGSSRPDLAGKLGGAGGEYRTNRPVLAGKLGSASGADEFVLSDPEEAPGCGGEGITRSVALGGKVGGSMDLPVALGAKIAAGGGGD